jgi:hypothetical protein
MYVMFWEASGMITFGRPNNKEHSLTAKRLNKFIMATELFRKLLLL